MIRNIINREHEQIYLFEIDTLINCLELLFYVLPIAPDLRRV
jgi:hypothetical protein